MGVENLKELLVDEQKVLEDVLLDTLKGVVSLDSRSGEMYGTNRYISLKPEAKICVFLMARKAAHLLGLGTDEAASAKAVRERTGMPMGTVNPKLRFLVGKGVIAQNKGKEYYLPPHALAIARQIIKGGEK